MKLNYILFSYYVLSVIGFSCGYLTKAASRQKRVCVIGAGIAGLTSARYLKEEGIPFTVIEVTQYVGGTWRYDPRVGTDEYGIPIHTSMYKHLKTNLPRPTMELRDFPLPDNIDSFVPWSVYYNYIKDYAKHFGLEKHIQFLHQVTKVSRVGNIWKVKYRNVQTGDEKVEDFDFVIVGNGHHSKPTMPGIPGEDRFKGTIIHSHDYREPDPYMGRRVLVVGAGPSGMDISIDVAYVATRLVHSHHSIVDWKTRFPKHYTRKPDLKEFNETGVFFVDGTFEEIDDVIYCTGYDYDYPFLDESCGLTISPQSVIPLYKYMVNINQPSMVLIGLIIRACVVVAIEAQSRYATALIKGNFTLPSKEEMMAEWQSLADKIEARGRPLSDVHFLGDKEDKYYEDLTKESGIARVPPVMYKIRVMDTAAKIADLYTYRNYVYKVIDDENFVRTLKDEAKNYTAKYSP